MIHVPRTYDKHMLWVSNKVNKGWLGKEVTEPRRTLYIILDLICRSYADLIVCRGYKALAQLSRFVSPPPPQVSTAETMRAVLLVVVLGTLASVQAASVSDEIVRHQWKVSLCIKLHSDVSYNLHLLAADSSSICPNFVWLLFVCCDQVRKLLANAC